MLQTTFVLVLMTWASIIIYANGDDKLSCYTCYAEECEEEELESQECEPDETVCYSQLEVMEKACAKEEWAKGNIETLKNPVVIVPDGMKYYYCNKPNCNKEWDPPADAIDSFVKEDKN